MISIDATTLPDEAFLTKYAPRSVDDPSYTDCFQTRVDAVVTLSDFIYAFYTSLPFKTERAILAVAVDKPSRDAEARQLADGLRTDFSAWTVEDRSDDQILLCDMTGGTRSWLMVAPAAPGTMLYFGSAVVTRTRGGVSRRSPLMRALTPFHLVYSRVLLGAAAMTLQRRGESL